MTKHAYRGEAVVYVILFTISNQTVRAGMFHANRPTTNKNSASDLTMSYAAGKNI